MPDNHSPLYRFTCPHCGRILKAPLAWAGRRGTCPACRFGVVFPSAVLAPGQSVTASQILAIIAADDQPVASDGLDRLAMLLAQGTCMEYSLARENLPGGKLAVGQWRRVLTRAGKRESLRLELLHGMQHEALAAEDSAAPVLALPPERTADPTQAAWQIVARFTHFLRHGRCQGCQANPTGMGCVYQSFEAFIAAGNWDPARIHKWEHSTRQAFGLNAQAVAIAVPI